MIEILPLDYWSSGANSVFILTVFLYTLAFIYPTSNFLDKHSVDTMISQVIVSWCLPITANFDTQFCLNTTTLDYFHDNLLLPSNSVW